MNGDGLRIETPVIDQDRRLVIVDLVEHFRRFVQQRRHEGRGLGFVRLDVAHRGEEAFEETLDSIGLVRDQVFLRENHMRHEIGHEAFGPGDDAHLALVGGDVGILGAGHHRIDLMREERAVHRGAGAERDGFDAFGAPALMHAQALHQPFGERAGRADRPALAFEIVRRS